MRAVSFLSGLLSAAIVFFAMLLFFMVETIGALGNGALELVIATLAVLLLLLVLTAVAGAGIWITGRFRRRARVEARHQAPD